MKASDFFKSRGKPAPSLPVKLRLVGDVESQQEVREATAAFRFVPDRIKTDADADASKALAALTAKGVPVTPEIRASVEHSHMLHAILRDAQSPAEIFFDSAEECRSMLMPSERLRLLAAYQAWTDLEFPPDFTSERFKEAMADAEGFSVSSLLTKYGYGITRLCVISLAVTPTMLPTPS